MTPLVVKQYAPSEPLELVSVVMSHERGAKPAGDGVRALVQDVPVAEVDEDGLVAGSYDIDVARVGQAVEMI